MFNSLAITSVFAAGASTKFADVVKEYVKKDGKDKEFSKKKGVYVLKIDDSDSVTLNNKPVNQVGNQSQLTFEDREIYIRSISSVEEGGKKLKLVEFANGQSLKAAVNSTTNVATIYFINKGIDLDTVNTSPEDGVVILPGGELTVKQDKPSKQQWKNTGRIAVLPESGKADLTAVDSRLTGTSMKTPVTWENSKGAELTTWGDAIIGTKNGTSENKGTLVVRRGTTAMAPGSNLLNSGSIAVDGVFQGNIILTKPAAKVVLHSRRAGYTYDQFLTESSVPLVGSPDRSVSAIVDLMDERVSQFYSYNPSETGIVRGKISVMEGPSTRTLYSGPDDLLPDNPDPRLEIHTIDAIDPYDLDSTTAIRVSEIPIELTRPGHLRAALYSEDGYTSYNEATGYGEVPAVDTRRVIRQNVGDGNTLYLDHDNSWFNGVWMISSGTADVPSTGSIPGGDIIIEDGAELYWHGGAKDKNNRPTINLVNGGELIFDLDSEGEAFSVYGKIKSQDKKAKIWFDKGKINIKNDCSEYQGQLIVSDGAEFVIRKDGEHKGRMFGGTVEIDGTAVIHTTSGMNPVTIGSGTAVFRNTPDTPGDETSNEVKDVTIEKNATVKVEFDNAIISGTNLKGIIIVGENATFRDLDMDGGKLVMAPETKHLHIVNARWGSTLNTIDARIAEVTFGQLQIRDDHDMLWELDFDPATGKCDHITVEDLHFTEGSSLVVAGYVLLSPPERERYIFNILTISNGGRYPNIKIGTTKEVEGSLGKYKLYAEGGPGCVTLRLPDAPFQDATAEQLTILYESIEPLSTLQQVSLNSSFDVHHAVFAETSPEYFYGKYRFWNKSFYSGMDFNSAKDNAADARILSLKYCTVVGCDFHARKFGQNAYTVPTLFMHYATGRTAYDEHQFSKRGMLSEYMVGFKETWFFGRNVFEAVASYGFTKNTLREEGTKQTHTTSNIFGFSAKLSRSFDLGRRFSLKPELMVHASYFMNSSSTSDKNKEENKDSGKFAICPGLYLINTSRNRFSFSMGGRWNYEICKSLKSKFQGDAVKHRKMKKGSIEVSFALSKEFRNKVHIGAEISRSFLSKSGVRASISISKEF
ncbi:MAG: hypothetical protein LBF65_01990 [Holosporales bacterium]|nr:hypothetical protein [Holosporales bacterium]